MDIEDAMKKAGEFGRFQKKLFTIINLFQLIAAAYTLGITFIGLQPSWHCSGQDTITNSTEKCYYYEHTKTCKLIYNQQQFYSISQEWNLICSKSHYSSFTQSGFFLGFLFGSFIFGRLADIIGRRKVVIASFVSIVTLSGLTALSPNIYIFGLCRFANGIGTAGIIPFFVLISELVGPTYRSMLSVSVSSVFAIGFVTLSLAAYYLNNWRSLTILVFLLALPFLAFYRLIPESPRWLMSIGDELKARQVILSIAKANKTSLPQDFKLKQVLKDSTDSTAGIMDLLNHGVMFKRTIILMNCWFAVCMVYYGLSLGVGNLSNNIYISLSLSGIVEIPSYLLAFVLLERYGRKWSNFIFLFCGGVASIGCAIIQLLNFDNDGELKLALALLGKFSISAAFCVIYTYTAELYSTDVRNLGMSICNVIARLGGIIAPLVILLDNTTSGLSMLVMGSIGFIASIFSLGLPETLHSTLPDTLNDIK